jgi:serine/threonine-protein kinase
VEGTPFGRYRLIQLLGRGGMGEVWLAHDTAADNRKVAIKLLPAHLAGDDMFVQRFRREAAAAAQLNNPHVIPIHQYGEIGGRLYVDMRLVEGRDLQEVLSEGPLEPARAVRIIEQVAKALQAAHKIGLVHRDVKPSNVLLDQEDFAYLIDFGIARGADQTRLTGTGAMIGSFHYMAPERFRAREADARADIYALACVLYECLTGSPPFPGDSMESQVAGHLTDPPPQPSTTQSTVPPPFDAVIAKGMAKDPDNRYATTVELANAAHDAITIPLPREAPPPLAEPTQPVQAPAQPTADATATSATERTTQQQPRHPTLAATPQRPPDVGAGWPSHGQETQRAHGGPPRHIGAPPPYVGAPPSTPHVSAPPPPGQRQRRRVRGPLIGWIVALVVVVVLAAAGVTYLLWPRPPASPTPTSQPAPSSAQTATPTTGYGPGIRLPFTDLKRPFGVAVDTAGAVYVTEEDNNQVVKLAAGSSTQAVLPFTGLNYPVGVAVDSAGSVYVTDLDNNRVLMLAAGSSTQTVLPFTGLSRPVGVAVDTAGSVYVADANHDRVVKLTAGSSIQAVLPFTGLSDPVGVAVDTAGSVYVTDHDNKRVVKLAAGSSTQTALPFTGLKNPSGVAVDTAGNLFVVDGSRGLKLAAGSSRQEEVFSGSGGVAVDTESNLYVVGYMNVVEKWLAHPA